MTRIVSVKVEKRGYLLFVALLISSDNKRFHKMCYNYTMPLNEPDIYPYSVTDISSRDVLVVAPHPDDESLGCGGSIIKHLRAGSRVKVIFLTNGDKGDFKRKFGKDYVETRKKSSLKAMDTLGVKDYEFWGYGDRELDSTFGSVSKRLRKSVDSFNPSVVYAPSPYESHPDHRTAFRLVWELKEQFNISVAFYEVLMTVYPNMLVDITGEMKKKKKAIECYHTEVYYNDYVEKITGLNRFRTVTLSKDVKYAEAFVLIDKSSNISVSPALSCFASAMENNNLG
jgi:LmbE family N-acetylglucosaminyl deacetylase